MNVTKAFWYVKNLPSNSLCAVLDVQMQLVVEDRVTDKEYYQVRRMQMLKNELADLEARSLTLDDEKKTLDMEIEHTKAAMAFEQGRFVSVQTGNNTDSTAEAGVCASPHRLYLGSGLDFKLSKSYFNARPV